MMHHQFLSPRQPLYGRATAVIRVEEIGPGDLVEFLPRYSAQQLVETYSVIGGVPKYLELWDDGAPVLQNVERLILSPASLFRHEALMLIQDEIAEPRSYLAILECLGAGLKSPAELAREAGIAINHIGKYLRTLVDLRLVRRVLSEDVPDRQRTRTSRYEIRDPFLRFYFQFVYRYPELVEQDRTERLAEIIRSGFDSYVGRTGYEELARRVVAEAADRQELPFAPLYVGRAWDRQAEIDLVAISRKERAVLLGECKWHGTKMGPEDLADLRARAEKLKRIQGFKKHYALFSRSGFTKPLERQALQESILLFDGPGFQRISE
jgi:AAA+ ATPase superfamily predicted ATPase